MFLKFSTEAILTCIFLPVEVLFVIELSIWKLFWVSIWTYGFQFLLHHSEWHSNGATPAQPLKSGLFQYVLALCAMAPLSYIILQNCSQWIFRQTTGYRLIAIEKKRHVGGRKCLPKRFWKKYGMWFLLYMMRDMSYYSVKCSGPHTGHNWDCKFAKCVLSIITSCEWLNLAVQTEDCFLH